MRKIRICIVTHLFLPHVGGIERVVYEQSKRLLERGYEPIILTSQMTLEESYMVNGLKVYCYPIFRVGFRRGIPYVIPKPSSLGLFANIIKRCALVHVHGHPYLSSYLALKIGRNHEKPIVLTQHNTFIDYGAFWNLAETLNDYIIGSSSLRLPDRIIVVSKATMRYVMRLGANPNKIRLIYNGVDLNRFKPAIVPKEQIRKELGLPADKFIVLTVRRLVYKNGIDYLLEAARIAVEKNQRMLFIVAGSGPDREKIRAKVMEYDLNRHFSLLGFVPDELLPKYYHASDVFALPSKSGEGMPLVLLEAMACALPVVATDVGGTSEIINDKCGKLVPPNDAETFARALVEFSNGDLSTFQNEARKLVEERYSWDKNVEMLVNIYEELI
ncbi:MAG: glycosyltransferase family 4 protein [Candidatus Bathyarchaeia archaeon]